MLFRCQRQRKETILIVLSNEIFVLLETILSITWLSKLRYKKSPLYWPSKPSFIQYAKERSILIHQVCDSALRRSALHDVKYWNLFMFGTKMHLQMCRGPLTGCTAFIKAHFIFVNVLYASIHFNLQMLNKSSDNLIKPQFLGLKLKCFIFWQWMKSTKIKIDKEFLIELIWQRIRRIQQLSLCWRLPEF